jgi:hypothetical protein
MSDPNKLGVGVMIGMLCGNEKTVETLNAALGNRIDMAMIDKEGDCALVLALGNGKTIRFRDNGRSCCESRYMTCDDDLSKYVGATLLGAEARKAPGIKCEYGDHEVMFLIVKTSRGDITAETHNEHNGYYGGFLPVVEEV